MFGVSTAKPFGQTPNSSSPFGLQPQVLAFGQTSNSSSNSFTPGSVASAPTPFGSSTGTSIFAEKVAGESGAFTSPLSSVSGFGAPSSPALPTLTSSTSAASIPAFGNSSFSAFGQAPSSSPFGFQSQVGAFGQTSNSSSNSFAPGSFASAPNPFGSSTGASIFAGKAAGEFGPFTAPLSSVSGFGAPSSFALPTSTSTTIAASISASGSSSFSAFGQSPSSCAFGSQTRVGDIMQISSSSSSCFAPGSFGSTGTPFGTATGASIFAGNAAGASGTFSSPSSSVSIFGTSSSPAFGSSTSSTAAASISAFGSSSLSSSGFSAPITALGRSPSSITFGPQSVFGHASNSCIDSFAPKAFGIQAPFGAFTGGPTFIGKSAATNGANSSPISSVSMSGKSVPPAFGSSTTCRGTCSVSAIRISSASYIGPSAFKKIPGSLFQKPQTTSANHVFGPSTVFGTSNLSSFDRSDVLAPGASNSVSHGRQCGEKSGFSLSPSFGFTGPDFSLHNAPSGFDGAIGTLSTPSLGSLSTSKLEASNTFNFGTSNGIGSLNLRPIFGQPSSAFGSNSILGTSSSPSGLQTTASTVRNIEFEPSAIKCQCQGSRLESYAATPDVDASGTILLEKLVSISAMPTYKGKSHEELRLEDYQLSRAKAGFSRSTTTTSASSLTVSNSILSPGTTSGFSSGMSSSVTLSSPRFQFLEPSVWKKNASYEPYAVLPNGQPDMHRAATSTGTGLRRNCFLTTPSLFSTSNPAGFKWTMLPSPVLLRALKLLSEQRQFPLTSQISHQQEVDTYPSRALEQVCRADNGSERPNVQQSLSQSTVSVELSPVTNPFGVQPPEEKSVGFPVSTTAVQHGISCIPVTDNPAPVRRRSMLTVRHLSLGRKRPPVEKYKPHSDDKKVPFYEDELPGMYKVGAPFIPRENPRAWILRPTEEQSQKTNSNKSSALEKSMTVCETGIPNGSSKDKACASSPDKLNSNPNDMLDKSSSQKRELHKIFQRNEADEDSKVYTPDADIEAIVPKLQSPKFYMKPPTSELVAKERSEPGFCRHVKDFVVGKQGYGSIKFLGETDVTNVDLESIIQFNYREVIIYMDERGKPPVGQGLNKPAEITLLNVKCIDKITGKQYIDGPKVDKCRQTLIKKAAEQGADFVSYDPVLGEWKFRVQHF